MMPRRKASTQITNTMPMIIITDSPRVANQPMPVTPASSAPSSPILFSRVTSTTAPTTGPDRVPRPPTRVISRAWPEVIQCTSESVTKPRPMALSAPARPVSAADRVNTSSL